MKKPEREPMGDYQLSLEWIAWGCAVPLEDIESLELDQDQALFLAERMCKLFPAHTGADIPEKTTVFICEWCGEKFERTWTTRPYKYHSTACRVAAHRARKKRHSAG